MACKQAQTLIENAIMRKYHLQRIDVTDGHGITQLPGLDLLACLLACNGKSGLYKKILATLQHKLDDNRLHDIATAKYIVPCIANTTEQKRLLTAVLQKCTMDDAAMLYHLFKDKKLQERKRQCKTYIVNRERDPKKLAEIFAPEAAKAAEQRYEKMSFVTQLKNVASTESDRLWANLVCAGSVRQPMRERNNLAALFLEVTATDSPAST